MRSLLRLWPQSWVVWFAPVIQHFRRNSLCQRVHWPDWVFGSVWSFWLSMYHWLSAWAYVGCCGESRGVWPIGISPLEFWVFRHQFMDFTQNPRGILTPLLAPMATPKMAYCVCIASLSRARESWEQVFPNPPSTLPRANFRASLRSSVMYLPGNLKFIAFQRQHRSARDSVSSVSVAARFFSVRTSRLSDGWTPLWIRANAISGVEYSMGGPASLKLSPHVPSACCKPHK